MALRPRCPPTAAMTACTVRRGPVPPCLWGPGTTPRVLRGPAVPGCSAPRASTALGMVWRTTAQLGTWPTHLTTPCPLPGSVVRLLALFRTRPACVPSHPLVLATVDNDRYFGDVNGQSTAVCSGRCGDGVLCATHSTSPLGVPCPTGEAGFACSWGQEGRGGGGAARWGSCLLCVHVAVMLRPLLWFPKCLRSCPC